MSMDVNSLSSLANDCQKVPQCYLWALRVTEDCDPSYDSYPVNSMLFYSVNWLYISKNNTKHVPYLQHRCTASQLVQWNFCPERNMHPRDIIRPATIYSIHSLTAATLATTTTIIRPVLTKYSNKETHYLPNIFIWKLIPAFSDTYLNG